MKINGETFGKFKVYDKGEKIGDKTGWIAECLECGEDVHITYNELKNHEEYDCASCAYTKRIHTGPYIWKENACIRGRTHDRGTLVDLTNKGVASFCRRHPEQIEKGE